MAAVPAYLVVTQNESPEARRRTALRACIAMGLLLCLRRRGRFIFQALGITLPAFRIAGGLILWLVALDMLRAQRSTQESGEELAEGQAKEDVAVTPLAIPILAGPGAISTMMVLAGEIRSWYSRRRGVQRDHYHRLRLLPHAAARRTTGRTPWARPESGS